MVPVEICINSQSENYVQHAVSRAWQGGASRIELCASMEHDGLTPPVSHIEQARIAFRDRPGLMVMIRPVPGGFCYGPEVIDLMEKQIVSAAKAGADGVVIGVLETTGVIHQENCRRLIACARNDNLSVTFHRAFDATPDWRQAMDTLINLGVDRILSCGIPWNVRGTALDGLNQLVDMMAFAAGRIEIVVGGGVNHANAPLIVEALRQQPGEFSLHAYSSVLEDDSVSFEKVVQLCRLRNE